ncbi:zinc-binding alcohol dehydrogenase family protein [Sphingobacterium sp. WQ 366]|uniref:Zinc-binding alcohol dehydrogenase family protein n=2 Tax=Sphingobacterium bovistauri TaxID=2781959 RepID=A0ABS7Z3K9_9SPHI|nr:zinc-binding alcohol dehydrogenase family protein [Sphingobacterium bovistauri]
MKVLVCETPNKLNFTEQVIPTPKKGESLLKIKRIGVCGTDIHAIAGKQPYFTYPRVLGHEIAAEYVEGDAANLSPGDKVTVIPYLTQGIDIASKMGKPNCATDMKVLGVHIDGAMCEYIVVPTAALITTKGMSYDQLVLVEPLAIGAHAIRRAQIIPGEFVFVIGAGTIGLGIIKLAKLSGAKIIAMDVDSSRLAHAKRLGADYTLNPLGDDIDANLTNITKGDMPTLIFDASGNVQIINKAFNYMAHGGRYVLVGIQNQDIVFSHPEFHKREGTLMSSRNAVKDDFNDIIFKFQNKLLKPDDFITKRVKFKDAREYLSESPEVLKSGIKTVIEF